MIPGSSNPLLLASAEAPVTGISRSLRFNSADSAYLSKNFASSGNRRTWTWSGWVKRVQNSGSDYDWLFNSSSNNGLLFNFSQQIQFYDSPASLVFTPTYRDLSAWYHLVLAVDTTQSTEANRIRLYINGIEVPKSSATYYSQNADTNINTATTHAIGRWENGTSRYFNGYLADVNFVDGSALDPTSFGEFDATTGVWNPITYSGSYGTNGFRLTFSDNSGTTSTTLGKDAAGSNNWTPNNFSVAAGSGNDSLVDVPTNGDQTDTGLGGEVRGNYCTLNPLAKGPNTTLSNGNLEQTTTPSGGCVLGTFGMSSGKWYWEALNGTSGTNGGYGIALSGIDLSGYPGQQANAWAYIYDGNKYNNGSGTSYGSTFAAGDIIGVAFDADNGTLTFYKNGVSQGTAFTGLTSGPYLPLMGTGPSYSAANFGQRPFAYQNPGTNRPSADYKALCTANLPTPTIEDPSTVMDVKLYTGNGSTQTISGLNLSPDLVWIKNRSGSGWHHMLFDTVRGVGNRLNSSTTNAELYDSNTLTAFNSTGFSLSSNGQVNNNADTFVAWAWDAGSSTVSNTDGSITSSVRANASAGFSIVTYTGNGSTSGSVGHGLNASPSMVIVKSRDNAKDWKVSHVSLSTQYMVTLNETYASNIASWNGVTSTVFKPARVGDTYLNSASQNFIAYCFAPVASYSAMGSYVGNGSSDGPFVYTGHRSRWLLIKASSFTQGWALFDTAREPSNDTVMSFLQPNTANAETGITTNIDILSNGFKPRANDGNINSSGQTYIFASFAESPFAYSRAR